MNLFRQARVVKNVTASLLLTGLISYSVPGLAAEQTVTTSFESFDSRLKSSNNEAFFNEAQEVLGEELYPIYRIVERLARANGLDERPWRVRLSTAYEVNAYASELNTLTFMSGLIDQLHGDNAALACVVGHEMAHHTQQHIPITVEVEYRMEALMAEAESEAVAEIQTAQQQQTATNTFGNVLGSLGSIFGGSQGAVIGGTADNVLENMSEAQRQQAETRAQQIYQEKVAALETEYSAVLQNHELEADEYGYKFMVRAGFDPQGCFRTLDVLSQLETSRLPSFSHPNPSNRIARLNTFNDKQTVDALVVEGKGFLSQSSQPLKYALSRDGISLRIESRYGTSGSEFPE